MVAVEERFLAWLESLNLRATEVTPLRGDVSPRRYFRVLGETNESAVLVAYPSPGREACERFLATSRLFETAGIRVPRVLATDLPAGLMLLEDLGTESVFDLRDEPWPKLRPFIEMAIETREALAGRPRSEFSRINPPLDARKLEVELRDARRVFLGNPEFSGKGSERDALFSALADLLSALATEPLVPSHRDFMSRNLMLPPDGGGLAVIDHQDACLAPCYYDLASLLNDSLFLPSSGEDELLAQISSDPQALISYRRCAVQRTLKATATYIKFAFQGFKEHLALVPPTLARAALQFERLPEGGRVPSGIYARWRDRARIADGIDRLLR